MNGEYKQMLPRSSFPMLCIAAMLVTTQYGRSADHTDAAAAERAYRFLTQNALIPPDFSQTTFEEVWQAWPEPLKSQAANLSPAERRKMAFERYGLTIRAADDSGKPLQYVVSPDGGWAMNCFACHGGTVYGTPVAGAPNNRFALQSLTEETLAVKLRQGKPTAVNILTFRKSNGVSYFGH